MSRRLTKAAGPDPSRNSVQRDIATSPGTIREFADRACDVPGRSCRGAAPNSPANGEAPSRAGRRSGAKLLPAATPIRLSTDPLVKERDGPTLRANAPHNRRHGYPIIVLTYVKQNPPAFHAATLFTGLPAHLPAYSHRLGCRARRGYRNRAGTALFRRCFQVELSWRTELSIGPACVSLAM